MEVTDEKAISTIMNQHHQTITRIAEGLYNKTLDVQYSGETVQNGGMGEVATAGSACLHDPRY